MAALTSGLTLVGWAGAVAPASASGGPFYATASPAEGAGCSLADPCALADAIDQAGDGDTVYLAGGTYDDVNVQVGDSITLRADAGQTPILDGGGSGDVIQVGGTSSPDVTIDGLTLQDGDDGVYVAGGSATIERSTLDVTEVAVADGVGCQSGTSVTVEDDTTFTVANGSAGIYAYPGCEAVSVDDSTFNVSNEDEHNSDGIHNFSSNIVSVTGSTFTLTGDGGDADADGIDNEEDGTVVVDSSTFAATATSASELGDAFTSGIENWDAGSVTVTDSHFTAQAIGDGYPLAVGVADDGGGRVEVGGSTFNASTTGDEDGDSEGYAVGLVSCWENYPWDDEPTACDSIDGAPNLSVTGSAFTLSTAGDDGEDAHVDGIDTYAPSTSITDSSFTGTAGAAGSGVEGLYAANTNDGTLDITLTGVTSSMTASADGAAALGADFDEGSSGHVDTSTLSVSTAAGIVDAIALGVDADGEGEDEGGEALITHSTVKPSGDSAAGMSADYGGSLTVEDSTIVGSGGSTGVGVDLANLVDSESYGSTALVEQSTITRNGTGVYPTTADESSVTFGADVIAGNGTDCALPGDFAETDEGGNLDGDESCGLTADSSGTDSTLAASLAPLANNGGPTQTVALYDGSPALSAVPSATDLSGAASAAACDNDDQRGEPRDAEGCDAGAFEGSIARPSSGPTATPVSIVVTSKVNPSVFGQSVSFVASVSPVPSCGVVRWLVDGVQQGDAVAAAGSLSLGPLASLGVGSHEVQVVFGGCTGFGAASGGVVQVVGKAATTTTVSVGASSVTASVKAVAPGAGVPSGSVSFAVDGTTVGSAVLSPDGTATLDRTVAEGAGVSATYSGDSDFSGSSGSASTGATTITDPTITARVSSKHAKSKAGWYRSAVTVSFTCTAGSAPLADPGCPAPVTLRRQGGGQSVTGSVSASDGGSASVTVSPINIDKSAPRHLHVSGATDGATYSFANRHRHLVCHAKDKVSGVASCTVTKTHVKHKHYVVVTYTLTATNNADGQRTATGTYRFHRRH